MSRFTSHAGVAHRTPRSLDRVRAWLVSVLVMQRFGDRSSFAVELGESRSPQLRCVDLWIAGKLLTTDDNEAFLPSFVFLAEATAADVLSRRIETSPFPGRSPQEIFRVFR